MAYFEGARAITDSTPSQFSVPVSYPPVSHWRAVYKGSNPVNVPNLTTGQDALGAAVTGLVQRLIVEDKPNNVDECTAVKVLIVQTTDDTFDPASGFMEFGLSLYKADGTTLLGTTTTHTPVDYDPAIVDPNPAGPFFNAQSYEFAGLSLSQADIDAGLIVEFDSTAPDGWVGGGAWKIWALWLGYTYSLSVNPESIVDGISRIRRAEGFSPISACAGDSPIEQAVEGSTRFDQDA